LPVTVKLRSGIEAGDRSGFELAIRLAEEAGVAAIGFHPRAATKGHKGQPDYALTRELAERLEVPVIVSGGLSSAAAARQAYEESGADAVMIARGSLGNPWVFEELTGRRAAPPSREEVAGELLWVLDRAEEHLGTERAQRYLRKFYPWYFDGIGASKQVRDELQRTADLSRARELIEAAAETAVQTLHPWRDRAEYVALGGDRTAVDRVLAARPELAWLADHALPRFFDVPDPRQRVLERLPYELYAAELVTLQRR